jgi:hypothetical protein
MTQLTERQSATRSYLAGRLAQAQRVLTSAVESYNSRVATLRDVEVAAANYNEVLQSARAFCMAREDDAEGAWAHMWDRAARAMQPVAITWPAALELGTLDHADKLRDVPAFAFQFTSRADAEVFLAKEGFRLVADSNFTRDAGYVFDAGIIASDDGKLWNVAINAREPLEQDQDEGDIPL